MFTLLLVLFSYKVYSQYISMQLSRMDVNYSASSRYNLHFTHSRDLLPCEKHIFGIQSCDAETYTSCI